MTSQMSNGRIKGVSSAGAVLPCDGAMFLAHVTRQQAACSLLLPPPVPPPPLICV